MDAKVDLSSIAEEDVERFLFCAESRTDTPPPKPAGLQTAKRRRPRRRGPISSKAGPWRRKMLRQGVNGKMTVRDGLSRIKTLVPYVAEQPAASVSDMSELEIIHSATRYITELEVQLMKLRTGKTSGRRVRNTSGSPSKRLVEATSTTSTVHESLTLTVASPVPSPFKKSEQCPKARMDIVKKEAVKDLTVLMSLDNGVDSCSSSDSVSSPLAAGAEGVDCGQLLRDTDVLLFPDTFFTQLNELLPKDLNTPSDTMESPTDTTFPVQDEEKRIMGNVSDTPATKMEYVFEDSLEIEEFQTTGLEED